MQSEIENISNSESSNLSDNIPNSSNDAITVLNQYVNSLVNISNIQASPQNCNIKSELLALCNTQRESFDTDVFEYWSKCKQYKFKLKQLVRAVLTVPATQVSCYQASLIPTF